MQTEKYTQEKIVWVKHWAPELFSFRLSKPQGFQFSAGQFARIGLMDESGELIWRAYSIASSTVDSFLEFFSVRVVSGKFSTRLASLQEGDTIFLERKAQGFLTLDRFDNAENKINRDLWMFATGTGLSAFLSMLPDPGLWERFDKVILVQTVKSPSDLAYANEIAAAIAVARDRYDKVLVHIPTTTRETQPGALSGRPTNLLISGELERIAEQTITAEHSCFMLCGNPQMVEDMRSLLKQRGLRMNRRAESGHIVVENYW